jgi:hypothetical protein
MQDHVKTHAILPVLGGARIKQIPARLETQRWRHFRRFWPPSANHQQIISKSSVGRTRLRVSMASPQAFEWALTAGSPLR